MLVNDFLSNSAARYPQKEFCVFAERRLTYADVEAASNRLAHALLARELGRHG
jgi:fatty-acyl-CoA synthase